MELQKQLPTVNKAGTRFSKKGQSNGISIYYTDNCKLSTWENVGHVLIGSNYSHKERMDLIKECLNNSSNTVFMTLSNEIAADFLRKHFDVIYCIKVPIGYHGKFQYHILLNNKRHEPYQERLKNEKARSLLRKIK